LRSHLEKKAGDNLEKLLHLLKSDAAKGMELIMRQYSGYVYTICAGHLRNCCPPEEIEACAAEVFAEVFQSREKIDPERGSLKAFICTLAKKRAIDTYNQKLKTQNQVDIDGLELPGPANTEDTAEKAETAAVLIACIKGLGKPDSEIFIRKFYFLQTTKEIASAMGLKENTVDKRVSRGYARLREQLKGML
jgi:RNA polymerase sigma-70 factor (ECF subfamily)